MATQLAKHIHHEVAVAGIVSGVIFSMSCGI